MILEQRGWWPFVATKRGGPLWGSEQKKKACSAFGTRMFSLQWHGLKEKLHAASLFLWSLFTPRSYYSSLTKTNCAISL